MNNLNTDLKKEKFWLLKEETYFLESIELLLKHLVFPFEVFHFFFLDLKSVLGALQRSLVLFIICHLSGELLVLFLCLFQRLNKFSVLALKETFSESRRG